ncbi:hypothetical protein SARC_05847 [Sphaeroforma arctica JP610]|uniref:Uncharacterized protein n=1 Tax=Sphaeroforma arctica JP610 TaxID=667725 RepID=A0A0L0G0X7_9EUKA|nr:hypothetical protein SARC_05847 [Sphaeroforma arctica JP610]KNC81858.1 hypothetical protein SARC_05847 [Sphaeroforma arctica JP610]|eukprot:XP_014155760.1 hypothetical protein SARC_05847 [Sphaeroforma arctica JP610]
MTSKHGRHGLSVLLGISLLPSNACIGRRPHSSDTNHHSHSRETTAPEHTVSAKQRNQTHTDTKPHTPSHTVIAGKRGEDTHTPSDTSGRGSTTETSAGQRTATHTHTHMNAHMNTNGAEADDRTGTGKTPAALLAVIATDKLVYIRLLPMARIVHTVSVAAALKGTRPLTAPQRLPRSQQGPKRRRTPSTYSTTSTTSTVSETSVSSTAGAQGVRGLQMRAEDTKGFGGASDPGMQSPDTRSIYSTDSAMLGGEGELGARTHAQMQTPVYNNEYTNTSDRPQTHTHTHTYIHTQTVMSELHGLASEIAKEPLNELGASVHASAIDACASVAWLCASDPSPKGTRSHTPEQEHTPAHAYADSTMIAYGWDNRAFVDALVGVSIDGERTGAPALNLERRAEYVLPCGLVSVVWLTRARLGVLDVNEHLHVLELGPRSTPLLLEIQDLSQHSLTYHEIAFNAPVRSASHDRSTKNSDQSYRESMERHSAALEGPMGHTSSAHTSPLRQSKASPDKSWNGGQLKSAMHKPWNGRDHTPPHSRSGTALILNTNMDSNVYKQSYNACVAEAGDLQLVGEQGIQQCTKTKAKSAATRRVRYRMYVNNMVWGSLGPNAETSGAPSERDEALESYRKRGNPKGKVADEDTVLCTLLGETSVLRVVSLSIKQQASFM